MKTVAIISEYNPFHSGHLYQVNKIREEFGSDTRIVAIMSGNFTQRGEIAIMDKFLRAECAVRCGVNLVLELPFPYSISSAEFFAKSGVKIADSLGVVDIISFGSELGDIDALKSVSENISSTKYKTRLKDALESNANQNLGYPKLCEIVYRELYGEGVTSDFFSPNNILALEYIKAISERKSSIIPHTLKRAGAGYSEEKIVSAEFQSATAIRTLINCDMQSALDFIPENAKNTLFTAYNDKKFPCNQEKLSSAIISHFRLNSPVANTDIHDASGGLYNRLQNASFEANSFAELTTIADTKKYTSARIRRAIWYSFFGVTSSIVKELPSYTQVLAMDTVGRSILKDVKKMSAFPVITKPSSYEFLSDPAKERKLLADKADAVFQLTKPKAHSGSAALTATPYVMD